MPEEVVVPAEVQEEIAAPSTEEQNESTESATETEQQESQAEGEAQKSKGGFQRRIDKLTREKSDAEREKEFWRQEALRNLPNDGKAKEEPKTPDKPTRETFASDDDFYEALTDWKLDRREEKKTQESKEKAAVQPLFEARQKFAETVDDYHEVMRAATNIPVSQNMLPYLNDPEIGPELGYFLATNPDEAKTLAKLGPVILAKTIVELQSRFKPASEKTATVSKAPPPPTTAGKVSAQSTKDPGDMNPAEYRVWRAKTYPDL